MSHKEHVYQEPHHVDAVGPVSLMSRVSIMSGSSLSSSSWSAWLGGHLVRVISTQAGKVFKSSSVHFTYIRIFWKLKVVLDKTWTLIRAWRDNHRGERILRMSSMFYIPDLLSPEYLPLSLQLTSARLIKIQPPRDSRADAPPPRVPKMKKLLFTLCFFHWSLTRKSSNSS